MEKYVLLCWAFGELTLTPDEIRNLLSKIPTEDFKEISFFSVIAGGNLDERLYAVREVARDDFIFDMINYMENGDESKKNN